MKLSNEINEMLVELVATESIEDNSPLLEMNGGLGLLCHNLLEIYDNTQNPKTQNLIKKIIDMRGFSLFLSNNKA